MLTRGGAICLYLLRIAEKFLPYSVNFLGYWLFPPLTART